MGEDDMTKRRSRKTALPRVLQEMGEGLQQASSASHPGINLRAIQDREHIPTSDPFRALKGLPSESVSSLSQARETDNFPSKMP